MSHASKLLFSRLALLALFGGATACGGAVTGKESAGGSGNSENASGTAGDRMRGDDPVTQVGTGSSGSISSPGYAGSSIGQGGQGGQTGGACPVSPPFDGTACATGNQTCEYGDRCGPTYQCVGGAWRQIADPCGPAAMLCPLDRPTVGTPCFVGTDSCGYPDTYCEGQQSGYTKYQCKGNIWAELGSNPGNCPYVSICPPVPPQERTACPRIDAASPLCYYPCNGFGYSIAAICNSGLWSYSPPLRCGSEAGPDAPYFPDAPSYAYDAPVDVGVQPDASYNFADGGTNSDDDASAQ